VTFVLRLQAHKNAGVRVIALEQRGWWQQANHVGVRQYLGVGMSQGIEAILCHGGFVTLHGNQCFNRRACGIKVLK
jgi:hypothetical protein